MRTIFFSSNITIIDEWKKRDAIGQNSTCYDINSLTNELKNIEANTKSYRHLIEIGLMKNIFSQSTSLFPVSSG